MQMRDVAAAADVALGTVYRYFSSKERLLLEAMAEQQADLRSYLHSHPPMEATGADRVLAVLARSNRALRGYPDVTAAMVRAFGSAANENADIVRKVTEIMTDIITGAIQGTERHEPTDREVRVAADPHAGVALLAERVGVRGRPARTRRRRPRSGRAAAARLASPPHADASFQLRRPVRTRRRQGARPHVRRRPAAPGDVRAARRTRQPPRARLASRRCSAGSTRRHPRDQLCRVGRGDVRRLQDPGPRRERELPLRRRRAALLVRQRRHGCGRVPTRVRAARGRGSRRAACIADVRAHRVARIRWS